MLDIKVDGKTVMKNKIELIQGTRTIPIEIMKFPGGEIKVQVIGYINPSLTATIWAHLFTSDDVMTLFMLTDAVRNVGVDEIVLYMPYIPYARQDRVCNVGESLSIRVFAKMINSLKFSRVLICDPHSDVAPALIERCVIRDQANLMIDHVELCTWLYSSKDSPFYLVCPDAGAVSLVT